MSVLISQSVTSQQVIHWHTRFEVISSHQYQIGCRIQLRNKSPISEIEPILIIGNIIDLTLLDFFAQVALKLF